MFRGLWGTAELPRSSSSSTSSNDAACAREGPGIGFDVSVGFAFVVAAFFPCGCGPNLFLLTDMTGSSSLPSAASRMLHGLWGTVELTRFSSSTTSSTDAACAQEGPANFDVSVGFVIATFFGPNLFFFYSYNRLAITIEWNSAFTCVASKLLVRGNICHGGVDRGG